MNDTMSNLILGWCGPPTNESLRNEAFKDYLNMIQEFQSALKDSYNKKTLVQEFPNVFENILENKGGIDWQFWKSNKIQRCKISYQHNLVAQDNKLGVVFVNGDQNEKSDIAVTILKEHLGISDVEVLGVDQKLTKDMMIGKICLSVKKSLTKT